MNNKNYWNDKYWKENLMKNKGKKLDFLSDLWVNKYEDIIDKIPKGKALDLGCGLGQYTKYLLGKGFDVTSSDISIEALNNLKENIKEAKIVELDMSKPLKFEDKTFDLVLANLSIHYFDKDTTEKLLSEIRRILKDGGYFIGSVNSTKVYKYMKDDDVLELEENFYLDGERKLRLWNREQFDYFFRNFTLIELNETEIIRWNRPKDMWEFIYRK